MQELESDRDMRSKLNLYKITDTRATKKPSAAAAEGGMEVEGAGTCCVVFLESSCFFNRMVHCTNQLILSLYFL